MSLATKGFWESSRTSGSRIEGYCLVIALYGSRVGEDLSATANSVLGLFFEIVPPVLLHALLDDLPREGREDMHMRERDGGGQGVTIFIRIAVHCIVLYCIVHMYMGVVSCSI